MRIAVVHSFYSSEQPSGENIAVNEQVRALRESGNEVLLLSRSTDFDKTRAFYPLRAGIRQLTGLGPDPTEQLVAFSPDLVHVHNLFPNIGTRWLIEWTGPLVHTVHNFRVQCSNGLFFRQGAACTQCVDSSSVAAIRYGCYRESRVATIPVALGPSRGVSHSLLFRRADALVSLSEGAKSVFESLGVPSEKLVVIPNGLALDPKQRIEANREGWVFAGRLSREKGLTELLKIWPQNELLDVVGAGPLQDEVIKGARPNVRYLGKLDRSAVLERMARAVGLIFPSRCFEMQPTVITEALSVGLPIVAFRGNSVAGLVDANNLGCTYANGDDLIAGLENVKSHGAMFSAQCLSTYHERFSLEAWTKTSLRLYRSLGVE